MADGDLRRMLSEMEDLDEDIITGKPWAEAMLQRACATTKKAVLHWCNFISKIGDTDEVDVEENVAIFERQVDRVYEELILDIETVHAKHLDKVMQMLARIQTVCKDLRLEIPSIEFEGVPLGDLHRVLQARFSEYEVQAQERKARLVQVHKRLEDACEALGIAPEFLPESPLPTDECLDKLSERIEKLESVKMERENKFARVKAEIADVVRELEIKPTLDFERALLGSGDGQAMITDAEMEQLDEFHSKILKLKETMSERITLLRAKVDELWNILEIDIGKKDAFRRKYTGITVDTLEALESEVKRCVDMRKSCMKQFIDNQRRQLCDLWDKCHCSDRDRAAFQFFESDCYTEDLFELHEREIDKWTTRYEQNADLYLALDELKSLWIKRLDLETSTADTGLDRYKNRGGQLLAEEKVRNMLSKRIPKLEENLLRMAEAFRIRHGTDFLTHGRTVDEYVSRLHETFDKEIKIKLSAKKMQKEQQQSEVSRSRNNLHVATPPTGSNSNLLAIPGTAVLTPSSSTGAISKLMNTLSVTPTIPPRIPSRTNLRTAMSSRPDFSDGHKPKLVHANDRRLARQYRRRHRYSLSKVRQTNLDEKEVAGGDLGGPDAVIVATTAENNATYVDFERDLTTRNISRSTVAHVLPESNNRNLLESPPISPVKSEDVNVTPKK